MSRYAGDGLLLLVLLSLVGLAAGASETVVLGIEVAYTGLWAALAGARAGRTWWAREREAARWRGR